MRRLVIGMFLLALILSLQISPAIAEKEVTIKRLDTIVPTPIFIGNASSQTCVVGNLNPIYWAIGGWMLPPEEYKLAFDPQNGCSACLHGFEVTTVHILLNTAAPCSLLMSVDVEEAIFPTDPNCPEPGAEWCNSGLYLVTLPAAGVYDIGLPINCPCLAVFPPYKYLLSFYIDWSSVPLDLVTDNFPSPCTSWNNWGSGWVDLVVDYGFPGNLNFSADAECCEPTIPVEGKTWGAIKQLYKQ